MQFISLINAPLLGNRVIGGVDTPSEAHRRRVVEEAVETSSAATT